MVRSRLKRKSARLTRHAKLLPLGAALLAFTAMAQPLPNGERVFIGDTLFRAQAAANTRAISTFGDDLIRFEVEPGEQWDRDDRRGSNAERAELSSHQKIMFGEQTSISFAVRVEEMDSSPGKRHALLFQLHGPNRSELKGLEGFGPPPFDMRVRDGMISFVVRSGSEERGEDPDRVIASIPLEFRRWSDYRFDIDLGDERTGHVGIWKDGRQIADYAGPVGYDVGRGRHYWKFGIYQYGQRSTPTVVDFGRINLNGEGYLLQHERDVTRR